MDAEYLIERRKVREKEIARVAEQVTQTVAIHTQLLGSLGEIDSQLNQGKLAAEAVSKMFEVRNEQDDSRSASRGTGKVHAASSTMPGYGVSAVGNSNVPLNGGTGDDIREGADETGRAM